MQCAKTKHSKQNIKTKHQNKTSKHCKTQAPNILQNCFVAMAKHCHKQNLLAKIKTTKKTAKNACAQKNACLSTLGNFAQCVFCANTLQNCFKLKNAQTPRQFKKTKAQKSKCQHKAQKQQNTNNAKHIGNSAQTACQNCLLCVSKIKTFQKQIKKRKTSCRTLKKNFKKNCKNRFTKKLFYIILCMKEMQRHTKAFSLISKGHMLFLLILV